MWELATVLEIRVSYFFEGRDQGPGQVGETWAEGLFDRETLDLVQSYHPGYPG